jgi:hypothetical protein
MNDNSTVVSQALVLEQDAGALQALKQFCSENSLVGLKANASNLLEVLGSNIHLGGVFMSDEPSHNGKSAFELAAEIHKLRTELPIFLRRSSATSLDDLPPAVQTLFAGAYQLTNMEKLKQMVDSYIFSVDFPNDLVRGIQELTLEVLRGAFRGLDASCDLPYVVKDKLIYGELFSLIPLQSNWCGGYMMLQTNEEEILTVIRARRTQLGPKEPNFRDVNSLLSELANMTWGAFKAKFLTDDSMDGMESRMHVPIIINHRQNFISFGANYPQLCFMYTLTDRQNELKPITLYQKLIFSLRWRPELFAENQQKIDDFVNRGELELF